MRTSALIIGGLLAFLAANTHSQTIAITGGTVHTVGPEGTLENATIVIEDGRIADVGINVRIPGDAQRIDATGKIITPGLFSPLGKIGLSEVGAVASTNDATQRGDDFAASFDVSDAFNPRSVLIAISRIDGITRAGITPSAGFSRADGSSSHILSGLGSVVHLGEGPEHLVRHGVIVVVNFGDTGSYLAGGSRASAVQVLRSALDDAGDYRRNKAAYERGDWRDYSVSRADLEVLQKVLDRSAALLFDVNRASDISVVLKLASDYNIRAIISGGTEAWMVANELATANVPVILDGINNLPGSFDGINARLDSAALLINAGVRVAFGASAQTHNARLLSQSAGIAVANGLTWDQALEAITLAPAQILGVSATVGSIEAGKEADLILWAADPLEISTYPEQVFIKGVAISMESRQTLLRDRYLQTGSDKPPAFRH